MKLTATFMTKKDFIYIFLIFCIFTICVIFFGPWLTNILIDLGRELYFPAEMLNGKLLYKDIFNIFGPLSYQINAVFYMLFGIKIGTLGYVGCILSFISIYTLYFISRFFVDENLSCVYTLFILFSCILSTSLFNFIYPYAYSILYAYTFMLLSFLCLLITVKYKKNSFLILSYLFIGISFASKYEYIFYMACLFLYTVLKIKPKFNILLFSLLSFFVIPVLSYGALLLQGVTINDFVQNFIIVKQYASSDSLCRFYSMFVGVFPSFELYKNIDFGLFFRSCFIVFLLGAITYYIYKKYSKDYLVPISLLLSLVISNLDVVYISQIFYFLPIIILIVYIVSKIKNYQQSESQLTLLLYAVSVLTSLKTFFKLDLICYGTYSLPLLFLALLVFVYNMPPIKNVDSNIIKRIEVILCIFLACIAFNNISYVMLKKYPIKFSKGILYDTSNIHEATIYLNRYFLDNSSKEDTLLVIPEGIMLNYMTELKNPLIKYYNLTPPYLTAFGPEKIIDDIKNAKIEYIVLTNSNIKQYSPKAKYCEDLQGHKICDFVTQNYKLDKALGKNEEYKIYKLKKY